MRIQCDREARQQLARNLGISDGEQTRPRLTSEKLAPRTSQ